jgi:enterochelin esterase-like enzyme
MGATMSLAFTGFACNPVVSTSVPKQSVSRLSVSQPSVLHLSQASADVSAATLSYKLETFNSSVIGGRRTYGVVLPPGYEENLTQRYPVIFLLHGGHGTPTSWFEKDKGAALTTIQQLYAAKKLPLSIIITPDGYDQRGTSPYRDPEYIDRPNSKIATHIGDELVKVVQTRYRTLPSPDFWAIGGLSSGGWGAVNVGLHHLNHFSILFSHSGYFRDKSGSQNSPIYLVRKLSAQERRKLRIYLDTGSSDTFFLNQNRQFEAVLKMLKIANVLHEFPGEHSWRYWRQHLSDSLTFVGEQFERSQPVNPLKAGF